MLWKPASKSIIGKAQEALAEELPGQFDVVTCMEMLEHVPDPASVVCAPCPPGPAASSSFSTINRNPKAWLLMIAAVEQLLKIVPVKGTHDHASFIRPPSSLCRAGWAAARADEWCAL